MLLPKNESKSDRKKLQTDICKTFIVFKIFLLKTELIEIFKYLRVFTYLSAKNH